MERSAHRILESLAGETLPEWDATLPRIRISTLEPGQYLFRPGDPAATVQFVREGLVKLAYLTPEGDEWTKGFSYENTFFASIGALKAGGRATFAARAIERTVFEVLNYALLLDLAERHMSWQRALRRGFEIYGRKKEQRERELLTLSASERYAAFMSEHLFMPGRELVII